MSEIKVGDIVVVNGNTPEGGRILVETHEEASQLWWANVVRGVDGFTMARLLYTTIGVRPFFARRVQRFIKQTPR